MSEDKKPKEESKLQIKLTIKRRGFEISTEGTASFLDKELDAIADFTDRVSEKLGVVEEEPTAEAESLPSQEEVSKASTADIPVIKTSKSSIENLQALFNTPWGRTPRSVAEIMKALEINAVPDKMGAVSLYLTRLVQRGILRRIEKEGKWAYFKLPE